MTYCNWIAAVLAREVVEELEVELKATLESHGKQLTDVVLRFLLKEVNPQAAFNVEEELASVGRELARVLVQWAYNHVESEEPESMPHIIRFEGGEYRRMNEKTPNREVSTRFGKITLYRFAYRYRHRESEPSIFPLELILGVVHSTTPALADCAARYMADTGASQARVLERLRREHAVAWGVKRLREVTRAKALAMEPFRHSCQQKRVLRWLEKAHKSRGKCKPVLAVGRDGVTVCKQPGGQWKVASTATMTVYDRSGKRLGTVYLGQMPESRQGELTKQLTRLIEDILRQWDDRLLPRLCYVTDAGESETQFYRKVLLNLRHPQRRTQRLKWYRIVDYFHTTERITTMAEALFGTGSSAVSWSRKMRQLLLKPNGPSRVLHSAAAMQAKIKMTKKRKADFQLAYNFIRRRTRFMDYHGYRAIHLPIGSGVTEAACKIVFGQRFKLSGMRWRNEGAQAVLDLRVILLSGIWESARDASLQAATPTISITYGHHKPQVSSKAA